MMILSRLAGFKPIIIDLTGTSPDGDEHPRNTKLYQRKRAPVDDYIKK